MSLPIFPRTVILANGPFPRGEVPLHLLRNARRIICCDGAANRLADNLPEVEPTWIVGDMDSLREDLKARFGDRIVRMEEQETNDLAKAFRFCCSRRWHYLSILGLTGGREDHSLGNLSHLVDFAEDGVVMALTDEGIFTPVCGSTEFCSFPGQQVSIFSFQPHVRIYSDGLKYPLDNVPFTRWWQATLNEAISGSFKLVFEGGPLLVFQSYGGHA